MRNRDVARLYRESEKEWRKEQKPNLSVFTVLFHASILKLSGIPGLRRNPTGKFD